MKPLAIIPLYRPHPATLESLCFFLASSSIDCVFYCNSPCKDYVQKVTRNIQGNFFVLGTEENRGTAAAYNAATHILLANTIYSHLLLLDQDSVPDKDFFSVLEKIEGDIVANSIVCPPDTKSALLPRYNRTRPKRTPYKCLSHAKASGMLVPRRLIEVGLRFYEPLFVDYVDWLFCWQARKLGYSILEMPQLQLAAHSLGNPYSLLGVAILSLPSQSRRAIQKRSALLLMCNWQLFYNAPFASILRICLRPILVPILNLLESIHILIPIRSK